jgi:hypothetical protein
MKRGCSVIILRQSPARTLVGPQIHMKYPLASARAEASDQEQRAIAFAGRWATWQAR